MIISYPFQKAKLMNGLGKYQDRFSSPESTIFSFNVGKKI